MGALESLLSALGLKKAVTLAGLAGGAISGLLLPGPLAAINWLWLRVTLGAVCGAGIAGYGAAPLTAALEKPDYLQGIALGLGLFGLSFTFKVLKTWNDFDLGSALVQLKDNLIGRLNK